MKNKGMKDFFRGKGFYVSLMAGAICVVAIAAVCLNTFGGDSTDSRQLEINEPAQVSEDDERTRSEFARLEAQIQQSANQATEAPVKEEEPEVKEEEPETKEDDSKTTDSAEVEPVVDIPGEDVAVMESGPNVSNMSFDQESGIIWPIGSDSDVLMNYSVDSTIYFKTLGQYKTNPALIISAEEGANVCSATQAVVTEVGENEEIGKFVETSIGDEYKIIYGQLDSILVENGTTLDEGEIVGTIGSPTKYYVEEGSNLYMQMTCADETVDPMIFLH